MRAAIAAFDWNATPLGPRDRWPHALCAAVDIMLGSRFAMCIAWGADLTFLYNDAYAELLLGRHPAALGRPLRLVWPDVWDDIQPFVREAMAGRSTIAHDTYMRMTRRGVPEDTWWNFSYSPLHDDHGEVAGFLDVTLEVTGKMLNERRLEAESARLRESETRFRALLEARADAIYHMSPDWRELRQLEGRGFLPDRLTPSVRWIERYVLPEDQPAVLARIEEAIAARAPFDFEHRVLRADGSIGWTQSRAVPIFDGEGAIVEWFGTATDVTGEHVARAALAASRERLELATRAARLGQFDYQPREERLSWDDRCRALFGLSPGASISFEGSFVAGLHPDDRDGAVGAVAAALDPRGSRVFDTQYRTIGIEDQVLRYIHAQGLAFFDGDVPVRLIGTVQDVTADRLGEVALREAEERLRLAVRATNDAIWDWDVRRDQMLWNDALHHAYGHQAHDMISPSGWWIDHIHPDDRGRIYGSIHALIDGAGSDWTDDYRFRRADGSYADVRDRAYVIRDADGRAIRMIGAMLDQTERRETERALERGREELEESVAERTLERDQIWQSSPDLLCVATLDGWYQTVNPAWTETLGWSVEELTSQPYLDLIHPDDRGATQAAMAGLQEGESVYGFENRYRCRDGDYLWLSWNAVPRDGLVYAVVRDVTAAHTQQSALAKAEEQLRQSQKMEAVGQLTGGIAHDFNNMLTGVIGSLELVKRYLATGQHDRVERYMEAATTSAQRAAGLTQRLLAFSRRQSLDVQAVDVNAVVAGVEELLRRTLGESIALDFALVPDIWHAVTDANQLESALLNLAINARDAMPHGGQLRVVTANAALRRSDGDGFHEFEPGDYVLVSVADTGSGMSAEVIAKAFDPFFTTKPLGQGTGLGLSMIYGFARQTGGQVRIDSRPDRGTTVTLFLRRAAAPAVEAPAPTTTAAPAALRTEERVMVVEDDAAVRMLVVDVLEGMGYRVTQAVDGRQAVEMLDTAPPFRLLVTDVGLPGVNGRQVADHARRRQPELKVLFVTGYAEHATDRAGFLDPGMEMMTKPFAIDDLATRVTAMLGNEAVG